MKRTIQTAEALGVPYEQWKALNEIDAVRWKGLMSWHVCVEVVINSKIISWVTSIPGS